MYVASYSKINAFKAHHVYIKAANIILAFHIHMYRIRRYRMYIINIISNKLYSPQLTMKLCFIQTFYDLRLTYIY